jgi:hypothetical protein
MRPRTWWPDPDLSLAERTKLAARVRDGVLEIVATMAPTQATNARRVLDALRTGPSDADSGLLHPDFFIWYSQFSTAVRTGDVAAFGAALAELDRVPSLVSQSRARALRNRAELGAPIDLASPEDDNRALIDRLSLSAKEAAEAEPGRAPPQVSLIENPDFTMRANLAKALQLIRMIWPALYAEVLDYLSRVVILDTDGVIGAADMSVFGAVFIGHRFTVDHIRLAEELVHESSHNVLNALAACTPLCTNREDERFSSPLRIDKRPMFGIIHQMFVLSRLRYFYQQVVRSHGDRCPRLQSVAERHQRATYVVERHGRLTPTGNNLLQSAKRLTASTTEEMAGWLVPALT